MNQNYKKGWSIFFIVLILFMPIEVSFAVSVDKVKVQQVSDRYAVVNWQSDQASSSVVKYGFNTTKLTTTQTISTLVKNHTVLLPSLKNNTKYYFNVSSTNPNGSASKGVFNFTTTLKDTIAPFINVKLPDYVGSTSLAISGTTEPNTQIYVYVNGVLSGAGFVVSNADGSFSLSGILLKVGTGKTTPNIVRIVAVDPSNNKNEITKTVTVDRSPPGITFDKPVPAAWGEKSLTIKGNSDEPANMSVYVDGVFYRAVPIKSPWEVSFTFTEDRKYAIRFYAVDQAGNVFDQTYTIFVDTQPLRIEKHNLNEITPSFVVHRTVTGTTKPGATVIIFVNNQTTDEARDFLTNIQTDAGGGAPAGFREIIDRALRGTLTSGRKLDYVVVAGSDGRFSVDIELTTIFRLSAEQASTLKFETDDSWLNQVDIIAVDGVGRLAHVSRPVYYTRCGAGGFFSISSPTPSPGSIPEPVLQEGAAQFSLTMDLKWSGPTERELVQFEGAPLVTRQAINQEDLFGRYNQTMGKGGLYKSATAYPNVALGPDDNKIFALVKLNPTKKDFKEFEFLEFPLLLELKYTYEKPGGGRSDLIVQRKCINVNMQVEPTIFDKFNPNKLLLEVTQFLDKTIKAIDDVLKPIRTAQTYTTYACAGGIVVQWFKTITTKAQCGIAKVAGGDIRNELKKGANSKCQITYSGDQLKCDCGSNDALQNCCESTLSTLDWQETTVNLLCDRIFCPNVPSLQKHVQTYSDLIVLRPGVSNPQQAIQSAVARNNGLATTKCASLFGGFSFGSTAAGGGSECEKEYQRAWGSVVLFDWPYKNEYDVAYRIYKNEPARDSGILASLLRPVEGFGDSLCKAEEEPKEKIVGISSPRVISGVNNGNPVQAAFRVYYQKGTPDESGAFDYATKVDFGYYYQVVELQLEQGVYKQVSGNYVFQASPNGADIQFDPTTGSCKDDRCKSAVSSYTGKTIPKGDVKLPNEVIANIRLRGSKDTIYSPTSGLVASTKAVCLPAMNGYLTSYRNILAHVNACFKTIIETGKGNSGACQALLSQVVCDFVIDAISCLGKTFTNWAKRSSDTGFGPGIGFNPFKSVAQAGESISETISGRYGETGAFTALFNENALLHSVCVAAFTGDWDVDFVGNLLTQATAVPVKSTCVAFPASRRFVTSNPIKQGRPTFIYYAGGMLAAGSDISSFSVQLVCSNDNSCARYGVSSNPNGQCDCFGQPRERTLQVNSDKFNLKQGDVWDDAKYTTIQDAEYRYDKLRIEYTYKDNAGKEVVDKCEAGLSEDGFVPPTCKWDVPTASFRCEFSVGDRGAARFVERPHAKLENDGVYYVGDHLEIPMKVEVASPKDRDPIRKYARFIVKNQQGASVGNPNPYDLILDEGVKEYTAYPGFTITPDNFGRIETDPILIEAHATNGAAVISDSKTYDPGLDSRRFIVTFPAIDAANNKGTYLCNDVTLDNKGLKRIKKRTSAQPKEFSEFSPIDCDSIKFRVNNIKVLTAVSAQGADEAFDTFAGSAFFVTYTKPAVGAVDCTTQPQDWTVSVSLLHSISTNPTSDDPSNLKPGTIVHADGVDQTQEVRVKVACKRTSTEVSSPVYANEFSITPKTVQVGGSLLVNYRITAQVPVKSVILRIGTVDLPLGANLAGSNIAVTIPATVQVTNVAQDVKLIAVTDKENQIGLDRVTVQQTTQAIR
jgi:hypothetical protein